MLTNININTNEKLTNSFQGEMQESNRISETSQLFTSLLENMSNELELGNFKLNKEESLALQVEETQDATDSINIAENDGQLVNNYQEEIQNESKVNNENFNTLEIYEHELDEQQVNEEEIENPIDEEVIDDINFMELEQDDEMSEEKVEKRAENPIHSSFDKNLITEVDESRYTDRQMKNKGEENISSKNATQDSSENVKIGTKNEDSVKYSIENKLSNAEVTEQQATENIKKQTIEISNTDSNINSTEENNSENIKDKHNLFKQIEEGISSATTSKNINIMLKPRQLGTVNVNLKFINNALELNISVDNSIVETTLKENLSNLEKLFSSGNIVTINSLNIQTRVDENDRRSLEKNKKSYSEFLKKNIAIKKNNPLFFI